MQIINELFDSDFGYFNKFDLDLRSPYLIENSDVVQQFLKKFKRFLKA